MYVELKNINKSFGTFKASDNVNFGVEKGKLVALLGPSGSGKTTILRMIAGLEHPDSGDVVIDGVRVNDIPASKRGIGFVFQNYALFRYMTVWQNVAFGLEIQAKEAGKTGAADKALGKAAIKERVAEMIELVGLKGMEKRYPSQLSGGQRQRVAFARAIAPNPHLLLLDEPFAAIDAKVRKELRTWLRDMIATLGITSIFVTHDQDEAIEVSDEVIVTNHGRVEQTGTPLAIYRQPQTAFTASFFGQAAYLKDYRAFSTFDDVPEADSAFTRPEFVKVTKKTETEKFATSAQEGIVRDVCFRGTHIEVRVDINGSTIAATRRLDEEPVEAGEKVNVFLSRIFVTRQGAVQQLTNRALDEGSVFI
ncbi:MAG: ABC transporter ATP-binding protein [Treponema sp.]|nr:ABC transporter ATP-binding protein [Treponema sp.]